MKQSNFYVGIMSGTSLDGIDVVIVDFKNPTPILIGYAHHVYPQQIKTQIEHLVNSPKCDLDSFCQLDVQLAKLYAQKTLTLLKNNNIASDEIAAIGCHGQTIKHNPNIQHAYTLQIGDPNTLAALTNITTVADIRRKDIALGGQGAPLTPSFHQFAFQAKSKNRAIINIGGIANITVLPAHKSKQETIGFDTGPGNTLMDHFCLLHFNKPYDKNGELAAQGNVNNELLDRIISNEPFFKARLPKSTGTDYFNLDWFNQHLSQHKNTIKPIDQLATLNKLTALTIASSLEHLNTKIEEIFYCGGGAHNKTLMNNLAQNTKLTSHSSLDLGIHPDWVEATAFAWFAKNTLEQQTSSLTSVTGASRSAILGAIYFA